MRKSYPEIWFLRHGETEWNREGRIQGHLESILTEKGESQAAMQQRIMARLYSDRIAADTPIFVSPLGRAQQTAKIALPNGNLVTEPRLAEVMVGEWEGRLRSEVAPGGTSMDTYMVAPGGEGIDAFHGRIESFLNNLTGPTIIVAHGIWGMVMRGIVRGLDGSEWDELCNQQGCVYHLKDGAEEIYFDKDLVESN